MVFIVAIFISLFASLISAQAPLSLDDYLIQVKNNNQAVTAARQNIDGLRLHSREADLPFHPMAFADAQMFSDAKQPANPFQGSKTVANSASAGVGLLTEFGLNAKLSYRLNYTSISGVDTTFFPMPTYYEARPMLEISQPLWRNGWGSEIAAGRTAIEAQALAKEYGESFKIKMALAQAEMAYWHVSLARKTVDIVRQNVDRAQKTRDWSANRKKMQLGDDSDLFQAEAALQLRRLELQSALDEEKAAIRAFNAARGSAEDRAESLQSITGDLISAFQIPSAPPVRDDIKAAHQIKRVAEASSDLAFQKVTPTLDLFASLALNRLDTSVSKATSDSFNTLYPTQLIGFKFMTSLDPGLISEIKAGIRKEKEAAAISFERATFEQDREWQDLIKKFDEAKSKLEMAEKIEELQRQKWQFETERHQRGRSTVFQVILFEQDYANAQFAKLQAQANILRLIAQIKTFNS